MAKDVLIIGCGPTGLYGWKIASNMGLSGTIIDSGTEIGGQTTVYKQKKINNLPGINNLTAKEFIDNMWDAIDHEDCLIDLKLGVKVLKIEEYPSDNDRFPNYFKVYFSNKEEGIYKNIVMASGAGSYLPVKIVEEEYDNLIYILEDNGITLNKNVVVFGGGDAAVDFAEMVSEYAKSVKLVHRRDEFRAAESRINTLKEIGVELIFPYTLKEFKVEDNKIKNIVLNNAENEEDTLSIDCDIVIVQFGQKFSLSKIEGMEPLRENNRLIVDNGMETSIKGIYGAGDAVNYPNKIRSLLFGFQEIFLALSNIEKKIKDKKILNNGWS